jgi:hypothetical protein
MERDVIDAIDNWGRRVDRKAIDDEWCTSMRKKPIS